MDKPRACQMVSGIEFERGIYNEENHQPARYIRLGAFAVGLHGRGGRTGLSGIEVPDNNALKEPVDKSDSKDKATYTRDVVTIDGDYYKVVTSDGVTLTYNATENAIALTQDLIQQADWFVQIYSNPNAVVEKWISNHMHLNIYEMDTDTDIYVHVHDSGLAKLFPEAARLSEEDAAYILDAMMNNSEYLKGSTDATVGWLGKNVWFLGDVRAVDGTVTLITFVGGKEVFTYAGIESDAQYSALLTELENLVITTP